MRVSEVLNRVRAQTDAVRRTPPVRDGARPFSPPVDSTARPPARAPVASSGASPSLRALPHPAPAPVVLGARGGAGGWPATHQPPATHGFTRGGGQHRGGGFGGACARADVTSARAVATSAAGTAQRLRVASAAAACVAGAAERLRLAGAAAAVAGLCGRVRGTGGLHVGADVARRIRPVSARALGRAAREGFKRGTCVD